MASKSKQRQKRASEDPRVKDLATRIAFVEEVRDLVNEWGGNIARTATRLSIPRQKLWGWLQDSILPELRTIAAVRKRLSEVYRPTHTGTKGQE